MISDCLYYLDQVPALGKAMRDFEGRLRSTNESMVGIAEELTHVQIASLVSARVSTTSSCWRSRTCADRNENLREISTKSNRHRWRSPLTQASALIQRDFGCVLRVQQTKQLPHVAKVDLLWQLGE
ncbi:hypothetical protein TNCV_4965941 [Trichonephila clavipes]|nr:hypothetical protein TNCV_4965941 [Trichonephila clavipes]